MLISGPFQLIIAEPRVTWLSSVSETQCLRANFVAARMDEDLEGNTGVVPYATACFESGMTKL